MRFMTVVSPAAAIARACSGAPCLITYQSGPIRMQARLREIRRARKGEAEADAQQKSFTCAHTSESIPQGARQSRSPLLDVSTELVPHGREQLVLEIGLTARAEPLVQRRGEDRNGHRLVDGGLDRPPPLA